MADALPLTRILVPTYRQLLAALSGWLDKAEAHAGNDPRALLTARLAPDMFPLATQVRFACAQVHEAVHRLAGEPIPPLVEVLLEEGRGAADHPGSFGDARARIAEAVARLEGVGTQTLDHPADAPLVHALSNGLTFDFTAESYARDWTLGQFYFHLMIAYAILRARGVPLGKADYVPHLLAKFRSDPPAG